MSLHVRLMRPQDAEAVVAMVQALADFVGTNTVPALTADSLIHNGDLIRVDVAERDGELAGACLSLMTFSTWRGEKGLYVVDLFINAGERGQGTGAKLLAAAAADARKRGARFIKLEVDKSNNGAEKFYMNLGFARKEEDRLYFLEDEDMQRLIEGGNRRTK
ncbi:MAG: N-acetyltransferase family protein [Aestuariivirga sp.]